MSAAVQSVPRRARRGPADEVARVVEWYFGELYGVREGPGVLPYYCDPRQVGAFALSRDELATGSEAALFRLFVALSMFQGFRDVVIMKRQRALSTLQIASIASLEGLRRAAAKNDCPTLKSGLAFDEGCDVAKDGETVDCDHRLGARCHVKHATAAFRRMGDMGKLPTSAWLHVWQGGGLRGLLTEVFQQEPVPTKRAALLVERFARVHRVGRKLATMFVSALSTPALAPRLTPWFPDVDGNELVVVDTNVARAVDVLRAPSAPRTYDARERWVRKQAARLDLRRFHPEVPSYSPRLVQQALYAFCSKSNRAARGDPCAGTETACTGCVPRLCPFVATGP
jgi:hypothetical protein